MAELGTNKSNNHKKPSKMHKANWIRALRHLQRGKWSHRLNFQEQHPSNQKLQLAQLLILSINIVKVLMEIMLAPKRKLIHQGRHINTIGKLTMPRAPLTKTTTMRMEEEKMILSRRCIVTTPSLNSQIKKSTSRNIVVRKSTSELIIIEVIRYLYIF